MKISLLVIRCKNIEISKSFYELFDLNFKKEKHGSGPEHYSTEYDGAVFELYPNKGISPDDNTRLGFKISNLENVINNLETESTIEYNGVTSYVVRDPDGRKIELN